VSEAIRAGIGLWLRRMVECPAGKARGVFMRFTIRDLFWLVLLAAALSLWWRHDRARTRQMHALIRDKATAESPLPTLEQRLKAAQGSIKVLEALVIRDRPMNGSQSNQPPPVGESLGRLPDRANRMGK
jgi:hypothetical protein